MTPRGIRNNNPGNLRHGDDWRGLTEPQTDPDFCTFTVPLWGIRALAKVILNYQRKRGLKTIREIVTRWAPPSENNTAGYIAAVCKVVGALPDAALQLDRATMFRLVEAIILQENGIQPYDAQVIDDALTAAGIK